MWSNAVRRALAAFAFLVAFAALPAGAATNQIKVAIDTDNNASTGCSLSTGAGTFTGAEQLLITTYDPDAHVVTGVTRQRCTGGTFTGGDTIDAGGWAVGTTGGINLIETHIPWDALGATGPMRLGFAISSDTLSDSMLQRPGGAPIMFPGSLGSGHHRVVLPEGPRTITLDGDGGDWAGIAPIPAGPSTSSSPALRFIGVFLTQSDSDFFLRFDVQSNPQAPTAVDDSYSTLRGATLTVTAPGVLGNDHDPNNKPLSAVLVSGPQHGTLTLNGDGSFTYINDGSNAPNDSFRYKANNGSADSNTANVAITVISGTAPQITSAAATTFKVGQFGSFTVTATGNPTPSLSMSGSLPPGVTFNAATGVLSGNPAAGSGRQYSLTFTATNAVGTATQNFTLIVDEAPAITSANATTFLVGTPGSFNVTASGFPIPTFSESGALPAGVTFNAATHVLGGTATAPGVFNISFTVTNSIGTDTQNFTLTVNQTPAITSANNTTFTVGTAGNFTVTATGFPTPTLSESGTLPNGVTFNATTGVLSGTPAAGSGGVYPITFTATNAAGTVNQTFTLTVNEAPAITSANATTFTVGTAGTFTVTATGFPVPTITETGALPNGVTFSGGVLSGTPAAGTGGLYPITFTAGTATQNFTLTVNQAPAITSANATTFTVGAAGNFTVTATGFPVPTLSESGTLPNGVTFNAATGALSGTPAAGTGGTYSISFTATNIAGTSNQPFTLTVDEAPAIISANNITFLVGQAQTFTVVTTGFPAPNVAETGALPSGVTFNAATHQLSGTATQSGVFPITFTASNGVAPDAVQSFTLTVNQTPAITSANATTFTVGTPGTFTVTATGFPTPNLSESGTLPGGVTFNPLTGVLSGTPAAGTGGTYSISFSASNVAGGATQPFTLTVDQTPVITSANNVTFVVGNAGTFTVTASGFPAPGISETGSLPNGVTYDSVTHVLSGTPAPGTAGTYPITFTASNGVGSDSIQSFTLTVNEAPQITSANAATFVVGSGGTFTVTATGTPAPGLAEVGALPGGVTFTAATGVLAGTPNPGTGGAYPIQFSASNGVSPTATQNFTLFVNEAPAITSANNATFTVGVNGSFQVIATGFPAPTITTADTLPNGITLSPGGLLSGTPTAAGQTVITLTASNAVGAPATQSFTITINQAPAITSANNTTFIVGVPGTFTVTTTASPTAAITMTGTLPGGVTFTDNGDGTATLAGTPNPATGAVYPLTFTANNGVNPNATQNFTLTVNDPPAITSANSFNFTPGNAGTFTVTATGFPAPTLSESGALPAGVTFDTATGVLSGTTSAIGTYPISFTASNGVPPDAVQSFTLTVGCNALTITPPTIGPGTFGVSIGTITFGASGGTGPYTFALSGTLPSGLTFNAGAGTLTGSPTQSGVFPNITVTATDTATSCTSQITYTLTIVPVGQDETYTTAGNTQLVAASTAPATPYVSSTVKLLDNDSGNPLSVSSGTFSTTQGGSISINPDGSFTYTPKRGFTGADQYTYTILSNGASATATAHFTVSGKVWYADNTVAGPGSGVSNDPYQQLLFAESASAAGDTIYVSHGDGTGTHQGSVSLQNTQTLWGAGITPLVVGSVSVIDPLGGTAPVIGINGGGIDVITVANDDIIKGVDVLSNSPGNTGGIVVPSTATGTTTIDTVHVTFGAVGEGLKILGPGGTAGVNWTNGSITALNSTSGIAFVDTAGSSGNITLTNVPITITDAGSATAQAVSINNLGVATVVDFDAASTITAGNSITRLTNGSGVILLNSNAGTVHFGARLDLWVTGGGIAFRTGGSGTVDVTDPTSNIDAASNAQAVFMQSSTIGAAGMTFATINASSNGDAVNFTSVVSGGTFTINGGTLSSANGSPMRVSGGSVIVVDNGNLSKTSGTQPALEVDSLHTGTITINGNVTASSGSGFGFDQSNGTYNINGTSSLTGSGGVSITTGSTGTFNFSSNTSVNLTASTNSAFIVSGGSPSVNYLGTVTQNTNSQLVLRVDGTTGNTVSIASVTSASTVATAGGVAIGQSTPVNGNVTFGSLNLGTSGTRMIVTPLLINGGGGTFNLGAVSIFSNVTALVSNAGVTGTISSSSGTIDALGAGAININGPVALTNLSLTLGNVTSTAGTNGVNFTNVKGGVTVGGGTISGSTGAEFNVSGGTATIAWTGAISSSIGNTVTIAGGNSSTIDFNGNVTATGTGISISGSSGTYRFNATNAISGSGGITIGPTESGTIQFSNATTNTTTGTPLLINTPVTAAITYSGTINKTSAGRLVDITGLNSPGTLTMLHSPAGSGDLTLNSAGATGISIVNSSSTSISISNAAITYVSGAPAFTASGNTGTINLHGFIASGTGTQQGMLISGGGTINVDGGAANSNINVSGGTGRAIDGTTAAYSGALNLTNASISGNISSDAVTLTNSSLGGTGSTITASNRALVLSSVALANGGGMASVTSSGGTNGISLTSVTGGTYTISGGSLSNNTGATFFVSGGSATLTYNGTMSQSSGQRIVNISGLTGGTLTLGGAITGSTSCTGITLGGSGGTVTVSGGITLNGGSDSFTASNGVGPGFTLNVTGTNNIGATSAPAGPAVNITNTTIGASNVTFHSVSATGGANGIVLNNTGSTGTFTITGAASNAVGGDNSGGLIQNSTSHGIALTQTKAPSFTNIHVMNTSGSGIKGVLAASGGAQVTGFTLHNSRIEISGTGGAVDESNVAFNAVPAGNESNVSGTVSITGNVLNTSRYHGVDIQQFSGTISSLDITDNSLTSDTSGVNSLGSGIRIAVHGSAGGVASITSATINTNTITNFPSGGGIIVQGGNTTSAVSPSGTLGVAVGNNQIHGQAGVRMATQGVNISSSGHGTMTFSVTGNTVTDTQGVSIAVNAFGQVTGNGNIDSNSITSNSNINGQPGYNIGVDQQFGVTDTPVLIITSMDGNSSSSTQGNGILGLARAHGTLKASVTNSNIAAPLAGVRPGIRFDSGNNTAGEGTSVCVDLQNNTSAGSGGTNGIGLRLQSGIAADSFGVVGMAATSTPGVEAYVSGKNPAGNGVLLISATSGFSSCTIP